MVLGPVWKQWSIHVANKQQMNDCAPQRELCSSKGGNLIKAQQHGFHRSQTRKHLNGKTICMGKEVLGLKFKACG